MKKALLKDVSRNQCSYQAELTNYYGMLKREAGTSYSAAHQLDELGALLDRCMSLDSPARENLFVEDVCRMARRRQHLAA